MMSEKKKRRPRGDGSDPQKQNKHKFVDQEQSHEVTECFTEANEVPSSRTPKQVGNLTGTARKVKDSCADLYNLADKWESSSTKGKDLVCTIANTNLKHSFSKEDSVKLSTDSVEELHHLFEKLEKVYNSLEKIVQKMEDVASCLKGVVDLEWHQNNQAFPMDPLFQTWPTVRFYEMANQLVKMYQRELHLRKAIVENLAHTDDRNLIMFYTSSWTHMPYIDDLKLLDSALVETGHR